MAHKKVIAGLKKTADVLRKNVVRMIGPGKPGHIGGACSCADIVAALYFYKMNIDPGNPLKEDRDRFVLSKGHASFIQYAALAELGYFPKEEMDRAKTPESILQGHPDVTKTPGVEANTGSLGQGLSIANGMALAARLDNMDHKIYVILGDGEINEGQVWEAAMFASFNKLSNVVAILDLNRLQAMGFTDERLDTSPMNEKWRAFGWNVIEIDGHNMEQIINALNSAVSSKDKPTVIIAHTVKGKGLSFAENNAAFHNGVMTIQQYEAALAELDKSIDAYNLEEERCVL